MLTLSSGFRIFLASEPTDMRKGPDGLMALVRNRLQLDPFSGSVFVFYSKRRNRIKCLYWSNGGFFVVYKRLEKGRFRIPKFPKDASHVALDYSKLVLLLDAFDLQIRRQPLWQPPRRRGQQTALDNPYA